MPTAMQTTMPTTMQTKVAIRDFSLWLQHQQVLDAIELSIPANQVTALIGPSGCGKSSLLRAMNRMNELMLDCRSQGQVLLDGQNIYQPETDVARLRCRVGMVFQKPNPFPKSVYDNVAFGLRLQGQRSRRRLDEQVESALKQVGLWSEVKSRLHHNALTLSTGQQQRLVIARAIALQPEVLLLDEPASALDPISTLKVEELIYELKAAYTVVIVTHNMQQAARISDYTAFLNQGRLVEWAETHTIFTQPASQQTEDYITGRFG